jgi:hypothetical protein
MSNFIEIPANKSSITRRKPVFSIGINDANYVTNPTINGKRVACPFYLRWYSMLSRCYSERIHKVRPTYIGCSVCDEWLTFSKFKVWMTKQSWEGSALDKDLIAPGNKIYHPDNCCFVSNSLNSLLNDHAAKRGKWPQGVFFDNTTKNFKAQISYDGERIKLGRYPSPDSAFSVYIKAKIEIILEAANIQTDDRISSGLRHHATLLNSML